MWRCVITCYCSLLHLLSCPLPLTGRTGFRKRLPYRSVPIRSEQRFLVCTPAGVLFLPLPAALCCCCCCCFFVFFSFQKRLSAASTRLAAPPVVFLAAGLEREAKFGWNSWLPWQHFVPPQRIGTGTGLSMSVCRQDLGHALC